MKDIKMKERFIELRAEGKSFADIGLELKVSKPTLIAWSRELELEISNLRAIELEALYEKHMVAKEQRINLFGSALGKLVEEFKSRDLSTISTEKIMDLVLKYGTALKSEEAPTMFAAKEEWRLPDGSEKVTWAG